MGTAARLFQRISALTLLLSTSQLVWANEDGQGFFYDANTNRYFTSKDSRFSIRPTEDPRFVERIEVSINDKDFELYEGKLEFEDEGLHYIRFRAVDPVRNWSPIQDFRVYVDLTPPKSRPHWQGSVYDKDSNIYVNGKSVLTLVAQDSLSGIREVQWENGDEKGIFPKAKTFNQEGHYEVKFRAVDRVGNVEEWSEFEFDVDLTAPSSRATLQGNVHKSGSTLYVYSGNTIVLEAEDKGAGLDRIEYRINDGPITKYQDPIAVSEKNFTLAYRALDYVGNAEAWKKYSVMQDTSPPAIQLTKTGKHVSFGGKIFAQPGFKVSTSAKDQESGLKETLFSMNGDSFDSSEQNSFSFNEPGTYRFRYKAVDQVGNYEEANPLSIIIDNKPPQSEVVAAQPLVTKDEFLLSGVPNSLEIRSKDEGVGVQTIEYSFDGQNYEPLKQKIELSQWKSSQQTLYYRAKDKLGNVEEAKKVTIVVRSGGPKVDLFVESKNYPDVPLSTLKKNPEIKEQPKEFAAEPKPTAKKNERNPAAKKAKKKSKRKIRKKRTSKKKYKKGKRKPASKKRTKRRSRRKGKR